MRLPRLLYPKGKLRPVAGPVQERIDATAAILTAK